MGLGAFKITGVVRTPAESGTRISFTSPSHSSHLTSFSNLNYFKIMERLASVTTFAVVTIFIFLSFTGPTQPGQAASMLKQNAPVNLELRLQQIRQLSKDSGLPQVDYQEDVCLTEGCLDAAIGILTAMNGTVNPCSDFFQFSCGRWLTNNPVPPASTSWGRFDELEEEVNSITQEILNEPEDEDDALPINQVKQFYKTCMDLGAIEQAGLAPLKAIISEFGEWQLLDPAEWNATAFNWLKSVAETRRRTLQSPVISVYVSANIKDTLNQIIFLDQPSFGLPRGALITPENYTTLITAYENFIVEVATELNSTQTEQQLRTAAKAMIDFEMKLATISSSDEDRYDIGRVYNPFNLTAYQSATDAVDERGEFTISWKAYLDQVFSSSGVTIGDAEDVIVREVGYIQKLIPILKEEDGTKTTLANYIVWRMVSGLVGDTTDTMQKINFRFQQALTGATEPAPREVTCANGANSVFGMAIGVKYIEKVFDQNAKDEVNTMVDNLMEAFEGMVNEADWMQSATKVKAIEKSEAITSLMAYPDWLENKTEVEKYYEGLQMGNGHFDTQLQLALFRTNKGLKALREPTNREQWHMYPGMVNAGYSPELNLILFPAGILQPPFFGGNRPKHQNYGGIGVVIGHEISHLFDNKGAQFDKDGNFENWWDPETLAEFEKRGKCIADQYSGFYSETAGMYVNGDLTLGENIGDNGGIRESWRAYQKYAERNPELRLPGLEQFSTDQLFFLGYANIWCESITREGLINWLLTDPHSPAEFRVKGPVSNFAAFATAYNCSAGDEMNPPVADRCTVW